MCKIGYKWGEKLRLIKLMDGDFFCVGYNIREKYRDKYYNEQEEIPWSRN